MSDFSNAEFESKGSRMQRFKHAFSSLSAFHQAIILESSTSILVNEDLLPSPPETDLDNLELLCLLVCTLNLDLKRDVLTSHYRWSESWLVSTWSVGSSMIALGATIRDALLVVLFANILSAVVICFNGRAASRYHVGYPVLSRVTFEIYGSYLVVVLRAILGIIWHNFEDSAYSVSSVVYSCISKGSSSQFVFDASSHHGRRSQTRSQLRHLFTLKSIILPLAGLGLVIWATTANDGVSSSNLIDSSAKTSTSVFAWGIISQFNSVMGANSALLVTVPDLARYSKTKNAQLYGQALGLPLSTLCAAFGIITTSAVKNMYGEAYWNPYDLFNGILGEGYTSKARAGVFFASASFAFATLGTSIACNITPFAADVTCLAPRYINIIRGQLLCLVISFAIVPWKIVVTANRFLNFLGGYSIFQGPVVAVMIVDYFIIRKGNMSIKDMYSLSREGRYFYMKGVNLRAFPAFVVGFLMPLPSFVASFGYEIGVVASHIYALGWVLSFAMGCLSYWIICIVFKVPGDDKEYIWEGKVDESQVAIVEGVPAVGDNMIEEVADKEKVSVMELLRVFEYRVEVMFE
ncbi:uncharacterized protein PAC_06392 [Phialocephala subalpina]|uniref:Uracil permease n=1 Tax=Phialocephala subalpina TaxID=576137 RepID=A0A1L7WUQ0_9HELO|nr:uncharacterized protein PAC_06392 [Phialocephala subalpina]